MFFPMPRRALLVALMVFTSGCATQANYVDIERDIAVIKQRLNEAPAHAAPQTVNAGAAEAVGISATEVLDLTVAVDQLRVELSEIRGQLDELSYGLTTLTEGADARLAVLEEKAGITPVPAFSQPAAGAAPVAPSAATPAGGVVGKEVSLPGVVVAPRVGDVAGGVSADTAFSLAASDFKRGHYNLAAAGFANFLEQYPESSRTPEATFWLGESYRGQGLSARATKVWEMQVSAFPKHSFTPKALLRIGETYRSMDNIPAAEKALKQLVALFPVSGEAQKAKLILSDLR